MKFGVNHHLTKKTAAAFVEMEGTKLYKTGDLASINENGEIIFHARTNRQIKLCAQACLWLWVL